MAQCSAVSPASFCASRGHDLERRRTTRSDEPDLAAQWTGVLPLGSRHMTSAPPEMRASHMPAALDAAPFSFAGPPPAPPFSSIPSAAAEWRG